MSLDAMKAERGYPDVVMGDFIEDPIGDIEYNMGLVPAMIPIFGSLVCKGSRWSSCFGRLAGRKESPPPP